MWTKKADGQETVVLITYKLYCRVSDELSKQDFADALNALSLSDTSGRLIIEKVVMMNGEVVEGPEPIALTK